MANFFKANPKKSVILSQVLTLNINKLDVNGCGIGQYKQKSIFVNGTLPNENVDVRLIEQKNKYDRARLVKVNKSSEHRVNPKCQHFHLCGGCDIQHISYQAQLAFKQRKVIELLSRHHISVEITDSLAWESPLIGDPWHYRRKARIGVQFDKKDHVTIGFRQKYTNQLVAIKSCSVLMEPANNIFLPLKKIINQLNIKKSIGHIEVICADVESDSCAEKNQVILVIRQLKTLSKHDEAVWHKAAAQYQWQLIFDEGRDQKCSDSDTVPCESSFSYPLIDKVAINFSSSDFIQVNAQVNIAMVAQAISWLKPDTNDYVLDLFCGLGNFSLPIAKKVRGVIGVEGVQAMVDKASMNAKANNIDNCQFYQADLNSDWLNKHWAKHTFSIVLLDPARAGAEQAVIQLTKLNIVTILYVSCDPATLARDSQILLSNDYEIVKIGLIDMFCQTKHVETMVLFQQKL